MALKVLSPIDTVFMAIDRDATPMHIGVMMVYTLPESAAGDGLGFLRALRDGMRTGWELASPFNLVPLISQAPKVPVMREVSEIDIDAHVRIHLLRQPGGDTELDALLGRLHSQPIDMSRPLWELHLIGGLSGDRVAILWKVHHTVIDGTTGIRRLLRWMSPDPQARNLPPLFAIGPEQLPAEPSAANPIGRAIGGIAAAATTTVELGRSMYDLLRGESAGGKVPSPYRSPRTALYGEITNERSLINRQIEMSRLKAVCADMGCTMSDLVLYLSGTALRTYLGEYGGIPGRSITAGVPINTRDEDDERPGSAFGFTIVDFATDIADPRRRLAAVKASNRAAKTTLDTLSDTTMLLQAIVINLPTVLAMLIGQGQLVPFPFGIGVSNVPGPRSALYLDGARLEQIVPVSLALHNSPVNVTTIGYDGKLTFGLTAATARVPRLDRLMDAFEEALAELEALSGERTRSA